VVDDDNAIRALLLTVLRRRGFPVDTAHHGGEAMAKLERCRYAVILLDLMMPRMSGWEVLQELSKYDQGQRPIVIVMTAGTEPRDIDPRLVAGTIRKPFDVELLVDMVTASVATLGDREQFAGCPPAEN
jgi:DNA-binding response OmpR family regulator